MTTRIAHGTRAIAARAIGTDDGSTEYAARAVRILRGPATLAAFDWAGEWARRMAADGTKGAK